jgi:glutathione S-transferase
MRLLGGALSPFVQRCLLAARMKGEDLPLEMPEGGIKTEAYRAMNPMAKMPTLVDADFALPESLVIMEYLEEALDGPSLLPDGAESRARTRLLARIADLYVGPNLTPIFMARQNPDAVPEALQKLDQAIGYMEAYRMPEDVWLVGEEHTIADATAMPQFFFLDAFQEPFGTAGIVANHPHMARWWDHAKDTELGTRMVQEMSAALAAFMAPRPA